MTEPDIKKGLAGVVVDTTAISKVNPETNSLLYRGYPVQELAATQPFEAVAYLLWNGELPDAAQLAELRATERAYRSLSPQVKAAIDGLPVDSHPMDEVRTAGGYQAAVPAEACFGLGARTRVERLRVVWPDGTEQVLEDLAVDRVLVVERER